MLWVPCHQGNLEWCLSCQRHNDLSIWPCCSSFGLTQTLSSGSQQDKRQNHPSIVYFLTVSQGHHLLLDLPVSSSVLICFLPPLDYPSGQSVGVQNQQKKKKSIWTYDSHKHTCSWSPVNECVCSVGEVGADTKAKLPWWLLVFWVFSIDKETDNMLMTLF